MKLTPLPCLLLALILGFCCANTRGSENAVVVINARSASSKLIANHYIQLRQIPPQNVIYLTTVPSKEVINIDDFRTKILTPIIGTITKRKLSRHIDYIIYSSDFPTIINARPDAQKLLRSGNADPVFAANSKVFNPFVSINAATYFLSQVISGNAKYLSLTANTYAKSDISHVLTKPFVGEDKIEFDKALALTRTGNYDKATEKLEGLAEKHPLQLAVLYWLARTHAWQGSTEDAVRWLKRSVAVGWAYRDYTLADTAFQKIQNEADFKSVLEIIPELPAIYGPSTSFRNGYLWAQNGMINSTEGQGNRYLLSAMLGVNRNQGNSEMETLRYLQKSVAADGTKPKGKFYFTKTSDVRTKTRQTGIDEAVKELKALGFNSEVVNTKIPNGKSDILGMTIGTASFTWPPGNRITPGAICENLTSFGGRLLNGTKQTKLTTFLKHGAAGSSGTVIEPFAIQAKFPHPRIHVHYVQGCTLAESFYQSVTGPFQLLIVGDPLCAPWATEPVVSVSGDLDKPQDLSGTVKFSVSAEQDKKPVRLIEMFVDGRLVRKIAGSKSGNIELNTENMPDGYHEFRFVAVANGMIQTRGKKIIRVNVDNSDQSCLLSAKSKAADIKGEFEFTIDAPGATEILLKNNLRQIAKRKTSTGKFTVPAAKLGRGPARVEAVAKYGDVAVRSRPIMVTVNGAISTTVPILKSPSKKPKSNAPKR